MGITTKIIDCACCGVPLIGEEPALIAFETAFHKECWNKPEYADFRRRKLREYQQGMAGNLPTKEPVRYRMGKPVICMDPAHHLKLHPDQWRYLDPDEELKKRDRTKNGHAPNLAPGSRAVFPGTYIRLIEGDASIISPGYRRLGPHEWMLDGDEVPLSGCTNEWIEAERLERHRGGYGYLPHNGTVAARVYAPRIVRRKIKLVSDSAQGEGLEPSQTRG